jgi:hypothetical protein
MRNGLVGAGPPVGRVEPLACWEKGCWTACAGAG